MHAGRSLWGRGAGNSASPRASARCRCAPARWPRVYSDAISRSIISASVSMSFVIECSLLRSRGASCARGLFRFLSSSRREGTARQPARLIRMCTPSCEDVAPSGAPLRRSPSASGRALRRRSYSPPASPFRTKVGERSGPGGHAPGGRLVLAAGRSPDAARVRGLLATGAGAGPFHTSRRNRFASLMGADNHRYIIL